MFAAANPVPEGPRAVLKNAAPESLLILGGSLLCKQKIAFTDLDRSWICKLIDDTPLFENL